MLTTLRIKNLALVTDLTLELQPGFNAITGETGAGKSIILGALDLVLGERADRTLVRGGADSCSVEAVFDVSNLRVPLADHLDQNGLEPCEEGQLVLKRTFTAAGANRQFVNGSPTTLAVLAATGEGLVDMHGPHDHQSLLHPARQLAILDAFGSLEKLREQCAQLARDCAAVGVKKAELVVDERTYAQQVDLLRFQVHEIQSARLKPDLEDQLERQYQRASNAARLLELCQTAGALLSEEDASLLTQAGRLGRTLQDLHRLDPGVETLAALLDQAAMNLRELQGELSHYADRLEIDPARLQELEDRVNLLHSLKRKYGGNIPEILAFGEQAAARLRALEQRDEELARLDCELEKLKAELWRVGQALSAERRKLLSKLNRAVTKQLAGLGFKQSRFAAVLTSQTDPDRLDPQKCQAGLDTIEFEFAPNAGEPSRPLRAIASSGEMARVMLGLKTVLAAEDEIPVLVFDEVDANVGGETAAVVGEKMRAIAQRRQVLCITHLPQVAAAAAAHYVVTKRVTGGRTISEIALLDGDGRVTELARMLGGQSQAARRHAQALLGERG